MNKKILSEIKFEYKKQKNLSEAKLMALVDRYNNKIILENSDRKKLAHGILAEAIKIERFTLLEAATSLNEEELRAQYFGMVESLVKLADDLSCFNLKDKVNDMQVKADDMLMLGSADKKSMKLFMSMLTDMSILTKGLLQIGIKIVDEGSDPIGDAIRTVKSLSGSEKSPLASDLNLLGTKRVKKSFFNKEKEEHQVSLFVDALKKVAANTSPGFLKVLGQDVFNDLAQCIISINVRDLQLIFNNYVAKTMDIVDDKFLTSMLKPGLWGMLSNIGDLFSGGRTVPRM